MKAETKAWVAKDKDGREFVYNERPLRGRAMAAWYANEAEAIELPEGSIFKLTGIPVTWDSDCIELK